MGDVWGRARARAARRTPGFVVIQGVPESRFVEPRLCYLRFVPTSGRAAPARGARLKSCELARHGPSSSRSRADVQADSEKIRFFFLQFTAAPVDHEPHLRYGYEEVVIPNHLGSLRK